MKSQYPECEKMKSVRDESQTIGEFLEWLFDEKGYRLGFYHTHDGETCNKHSDCGMVENYMNPVVGFSIEYILAEYFKIDLKKVEEEKRAMLDAIR